MNLSEPFIRKPVMTTVLTVSVRSSPLIWTNFSRLSSHKSAICRDPRGVMLLSTLPPVWEGHLQGLENPGLLRIRTGQARHAVGLIQGIGEQTETIERGYGVRDRDAMRRVLRGAKRSR